MINLWLDDPRPAPEGWTWVKTVPEAIELMESGEVKEASLDNDLGEGEIEGRKLVLWMAEHDCWPVVIHVHSANVVASVYMTAMIKRYKS